MSREWYDKICYAVGILCFLTGAGLLASGHNRAGVILSSASLTFLFVFASGQRRRIKPVKKTNQPPVAHAHPGNTVTPEGKLCIKCAKCGQDNIFDQPYPYHAGFGNQGFLYSDSGYFTLVWNVYDPVMDRYKFDAFPSVASCFPPKDNSEQARELESRRSFEDALRRAPDGGRWRFENPARCLHCSEPIAGPMLQTVYFLIYPGSILADSGLKLNEQLSTSV